MFLVIAIIDGAPTVLEQYDDVEDAQRHAIAESAATSNPVNVVEWQHCYRGGQRVLADSFLEGR